ncbi:malonate--CoA ligase [Caballeronia sp. 15711]|uniref:malonate--CoA ligase n=1 Tax=Caballeronia sp. 15711 TaxID=3391029 RepID=UPI0039E6EAFB
MSNQNLFATLRAAFPKDLDAVAIETGESEIYSWRNIDQATARMANWLDSLALPASSRIAVQVEKSTDALMLYLATLRAGYIFVPLNTAYKATEIEYFLENAQPAVVVCSNQNHSWMVQVARQARVAHLFTLDDDHTGSLLEAAAGQSDSHEIAPADSSDVAAFVYTSGTTGRSKGAMLTHGNLLSNALVLKNYWGWQPDDVLIHALPIFHVHGLFVAIHGALINGSKMIWLNKFDANDVINKMAAATIFMGVPTLYVRLLAQPGLDASAVRRMRLFISGSAPMLIETFNAWQHCTGHMIVERYGMSETIMLSSNPVHESDGKRRGGTVGKPLPGVGMRVVDSAGKEQRPGVVGGVEVRGPGVFAGYWRMPEKTAEEFTVDGWFKTGDIGAFDALGYLTIVGRSKDLIISGGYNVYPVEIESRINEMVGVQESAVVGIPHPDFGEVGIALVTPKVGFELDVNTILSNLKSQLANFKVPKACVVMDELPRNAMGKVQKNLLREAHKERFTGYKWARSERRA